MFFGLRHRAVISGDDQNCEIDATNAGQHVAYEFFMPGHIDEAKDSIVGEMTIGEA